MTPTPPECRLIPLPQAGKVKFQATASIKAEFQARLNLSVRVNGQRVELLAKPWEVLETEGPATLDLPIGTVQQTGLHLGTSLPGVTLKLRLRTVTEQPIALMQVTLKNDGPETLTLERITLLDIKPGNLQFGAAGSSPDLTFYSQGWQSWSTTGAYRQGEKQHTSILGRFQNPMVINPGTPQPKDRNHFTGDMFGLLGDLASQTGLLVGFLSQQQQFGSLEAWLSPQPAWKVWANGDHIRVAPGAEIFTDPLMITTVDLERAEPLGVYLEAVAREHQTPATTPVPVGWCSWYHFYQGINTTNIQANLESVITRQPDLPLPLFQIDDGFETYPGDWYDFTDGFPQGLRPIVDKAKAAGLTPGIWLAPYIVHPKARLVQEHPDWLLRDERGKPVTAGFVWNAFTLALDLTNPEALAYTCDVIRTAVQKWGFTYLKLDFLYAAALDGVYQDPSQSRAQVLRKGFEALREAAGPKITLLACGCPFGSALGLFEAMRVSADMNGYWKPHFPPISPILQKEPHMPAARNAIHNILTRAPFHRRWWINDPDCLLVRPDTHLSLAEVQSLATVIGLTGGSLLVSDDLPQLPADRLRLAQVLLPVIDRRAQVLDLFQQNMPAHLRVDLDGPVGRWHLLAIFNWEDQPAPLMFSAERFKLPTDSIYWLREFWTDTTGQMGLQSPYAFTEVPAHGVRVVAARRFEPDQPTYLGSDLHLSQGLEVSQWQVDRESVSFQIELGHTVSGQSQLYLPWQPAQVLVNGKQHAFQARGLGVISLALTNGAKVLIRS